VESSCNYAETISFHAAYAEARLTKSWAGDQMTLRIEMVVDGIVGGQKSLH
jgi:hypothetical protein